MVGDMEGTSPPTRISPTRKPTQTISTLPLNSISVPSQTVTTTKPKSSAKSPPSFKLQTPYLLPLNLNLNLNRKSLRELLPIPVSIPMKFSILPHKLLDWTRILHRLESVRLCFKGIHSSRKLVQAVKMLVGVFPLSAGRGGCCPHRPLLLLLLLLLLMWTAAELRDWEEAQHSMVEGTEQSELALA